MLETLLQKRPMTVLFLLLALTVAAVAVTVLVTGNAVEADGNGLSRTLVLDPGHGGFDGGAVSDDGTRESDLNLAIAGRTRLIAELLGQKAEMTRENDSARTDFASYSEHEDLVRRAELINSVPNAVLISIHQNDFPTGQPSGAQVLYAGFAESGGRERTCQLVVDMAVFALWVVRGDCLPFVRIQQRLYIGFYGIADPAPVITAEVHLVGIAEYQRSIAAFGNGAAEFVRADAVISVGEADNEPASVEEVSSAPYHIVVGVSDYHKLVRAHRDGDVSGIKRRNIVSSFGAPVHIKRYKAYRREKQSREREIYLLHNCVAPLSVIFLIITLIPENVNIRLSSRAAKKTSPIPEYRGGSMLKITSQQAL